MTRQRGRLAVVLGTGPILVIGLMTSGVANRLEFLAWAVATVIAYLLLLGVAVARRWNGAVLMGAACWLLALAFAVYGQLVGVRHEAFDLGMRAFLPDLYHPLLTRPALGYGVSGCLGLLGLVMLVLSAPMGHHGPRARPAENPNNTDVPDA